MPFRFVLNQKLAGRALSCRHAARYHGGQEFGSHFRSIRHSLSRWWMIRLVTVANQVLSTRTYTFCASSISPLPVCVSRVPVARLHSCRRRSLTLGTLPIPSPLHLRPFSSCQVQRSGTKSPVEMAVPEEEKTSPVEILEGTVDQGDARSIGPSQDVSIDPESDDNVPIEAEELQEALTRPPPVNSSYLPLPWKGRLGYVSNCAHRNDSVRVRLVAHMNRPV